MEDDTIFALYDTAFALYKGESSKAGELYKGIPTSIQKELAREGLQSSFFDSLGNKMPKEEEICHAIFLLVSFGDTMAGRPFPKREETLHMMQDLTKITS